jgi:hypothetical protein
MLSIIISLFVLLGSYQAFGSETLELPQDIQAFSAGYPDAPIIQCPRTARKYTEMLEQLDGLKRKIRSEACPQSQLDALNEEVATLENLITDGRQGFIELIQKGIGEGGQLSAAEVEKLQTYIDQVVKKVASVTGLVSNPACFDESAKVSTLSFLSSLVGEVSGVIGALTGPFGAKISLGGKLAAGLIGSIDQVVQARKTYDYSKREDRNNYLQNLCAYYQFKGDIDKETKVLSYVDQLWDLSDAAEALLARISSQCPDCQFIIQDFQSRLGRNHYYQVVQDRDDDGNLLASDLISSERVAIEDMTLRDLYEFYFREDASVTSEFLTGSFVGESLKTLPPTQATRAMRVKTIRALQAQAWFQDELEEVRENDSQAISDDGRREVMRVQNSIESFLINHEAPRYIRYYSDLLRRDMRTLENEANRISTRMRMMWVEPDPQFDYMSPRFAATSAFHDLFRGRLEFSPMWGDDESLSDDKRRMIQEMRPGLVDALESVRLDHGILANRCLFFEKSSLESTGAVRSACERAERELARSHQLLNELLDTSFARRHGNKLTFVNNPTPNYVADWLMSLTSVMQSDLNSL